MKRFIGFLIKEFYHIFRDRRTMLILFGMPAVQVLLFGFVITNEIHDAKIAVLDQSNDPATQRITRMITASGFFNLSELLHSDNEIEAVFRKGQVKEVIVFGPDFEKRLMKTGHADIQIIADASDMNTAMLLSSYTTGIIANYQKELNAGKAPPVEIHTGVRMLYNEELRGVYMFVPGIMALILMLVSAMMTSISITREKESGTMEVLLVSPLRPTQIIFGKVTPYLLLSFVNACTIILLGTTVFGMPIQGSLTFLLFESLLFIFLSLALGIFISTVAKTQQVAMFISMIGLMLPTIILSGFIFPIENMPAVLRYLSAVMPARWYIVIVKGIMLKGSGIEALWKETLYLVSLTLFFMVASIRKLKIRLE